MLTTHLRSTLLFCGLLLLCASCHQGKKTEEDTPPADSLCILFAGDVLLDRGIRPLAEKHGVAWLFEGVSSLFQKADATVVNLECPLTDVATPLGKQFIFRADTRWAADLHKVGISHAALANNHSNDQGYQGFRSTVDCLRKADIVPLGAVRLGEEPTPVLVQKGELCVALFNAVLFTLENWMPHTMGSEVPWQTDAATLESVVRAYRHYHPTHRIVCVLHWGLEFQTNPSMMQRRQAQRLVEAGADAIVGHHPHVVQPQSLLGDSRSTRRVPVAYSIGNFVFDQQAPDARKALLAQLVVTRDTLFLHTHSVHLEHGRPMLVSGEK